MTEMVAMPVTTQMIVSWLVGVIGNWGKRRCSPWLIWIVPRPTVVEIPNMVAITL